MREKGIPNVNQSGPTIRRGFDFPVELYAEFKKSCYEAGVSVTARLITHMRRDITPITLTAAELVADEAARQEWESEQ